MAERVPIGADDDGGRTARSARARSARDLMVRALGALERGTLQLTPQPDEGVTYADKIDKGETRIDWTQAVESRARPLPRALAVSRRLVRAARRGRRIKVLRTTRGEGAGAPGTVLDDRLTIACGEGAVRLLEVQRAGKQPMKAEEFLRGTKVVPGTVLR